MTIGKPGPSAGVMPRMRPGDFDAVWALIGLVGADKETRAYLGDLKDAKTAHDAARDESEAATAEAKERATAAKKAEDRATEAEAELKVETTMALEDIARRELTVRETERDADARETMLKTRDADVARRTRLLHEAGVVFE